MAILTSSYTLLTYRLVKMKETFLQRIQIVSSTKQLLQSMLLKCQRRSLIYVVIFWQPKESLSKALLTKCQGEIEFTAVEKVIVLYQRKLEQKTFQPSLLYHTIYKCCNYIKYSLSSTFNKMYACRICVTYIYVYNYTMMMMIIIIT